MLYAFYLFGNWLDDVNCTLWKIAVDFILCFHSIEYTFVLHSVLSFLCSCYANAVLQCLAFTPPLTSYFLQGLHSKACKFKIRILVCAEIFYYNL